MGFCQKGAVILVIILAVGAYYFVNKPIPESVEEPWKTRIFSYIMKLCDQLAMIGQTLGFGSSLNNTRAIQEFFSTKLMSSDTPIGMTIDDTYFDGIKVRIYRYPTKDTKQGLVFFHGGAWAFGSLNTHGEITKYLSQSLEATVVSVDYRLAPETVFPGGFEDCVRATVHFINNAEKFGVDPQQIVLIGDSAGGNLAAVVSLKLKEMNFPFQPKLQVLIYPGLQGFDLQLPSQINNDDTIHLSREFLAHYLLIYLDESLNLIPDLLANNHTSPAAKQMYASTFDLQLLPKEYRSVLYPDGERPSKGNVDLYKRFEKKLTNPYFAPLMAKNLEGLPEAYIVTMEHDPIRDDGILYAKKLMKAGVKVTWKHYPGGFHGVINFTEGPLKMNLGIEVLKNVVKFIKERL